MLGSKQGHLFDVFIWNVGRDDQDGWIGVAQLVGAVDLTDGPALIWEALENTEGNYHTRQKAAVQTQQVQSTCLEAPPHKQMLMRFTDILKYLSSHTNHQKAVLKRVSPSWIGRNPW